MWKYRSAIPIPDDTHIVSFDEGGTPLTKVSVAGHSVWFKQDHLFPSGSYKDRGASVLISRAVELGVDRVVEDSSGNAGAAIAAYCAKAGIGCDIYVPDSTSPAKLAQIEAYGATLHRVQGTREDTAHAALAAAEDHFYASHVWNPFFFHGTKTFAYEVVDQLGRAPDRVIIPTGNGTLLIGVWIGFNDLMRVGRIDRIPELIAVQAENCAPLDAAWHDTEFTTAPTRAEGIAIAEPARKDQMLDIIRRSKGRIITVSEEAIDTAWSDAISRGWFIEPTSAAALAAVSELETVGIAVIPLTGHGLKSH
jgi:threonine synthase